MIICKCYDPQTHLTCWTGDYYIGEPYIEYNIFTYCEKCMKHTYQRSYTGGTVCIECKYDNPIRQRGEKTA